MTLYERCHRARGMQLSPARTFSSIGPFEAPARERDSSSPGPTIEECLEPGSLNWLHCELLSITAAVVGTLGAGGAVVAAPFVLGAVGFTAVGITAGSWAAGMMSAAAVANGGAVAAGSTVAVLQSLGEVKLPTAL
ncbi:unnamed protein product [Arctogadus glacialis]